MSMSGNYGPPKPELEMMKLLHHAIDTGVTLLDTSDVYGPLTNEILIGRAIKGIREKLLIATKFGNRGICGEPAYVRACWEASLKRLDIDCIDTQLPIEVTVNPISLIVAYRAFPQVCHPKALLILGLIGLGHIVSAIEFAKQILNRDEIFSISFLIMELPLDYGVQNFIQSLTSQPRLKFIDISLDEKTSSGFLTNHETFLYDFIDGHKSLALLDSKMVPKIYPVGPVDSSVVFLCFGSMGSFEAEQIKEIATALEHCGHRYY
ncbi:hypothetical protein KY284_037878 [Solanum tuberosum]|nr:hypothetical protein KY284_037878 [Solanum tuberosum]